MNLRKLSVLGAAGLLMVGLMAPTAAQEPEDALGVVTVQPDDPIHIAAWGVMSGSDASLGTDWMVTAEIAAEDRGKLLDHDILVERVDGLCTPEGGALAATKMAADTTLVGLIGSACSDETVGGIAALNGAGLTTISPSATRPTLTAPDRPQEYKAFLRTAHSDADQGPVVAEFIFNKLGKTKVATIHDGSAYAEALVGTFSQRFAEFGGTIVAAEAVGKLDTDMKGVLTSVAAAQPEALYYPIFTAAGGFITAQTSEVAGLENVDLVGSDGLFSPAFIRAAGPNVEGMYLSAPHPSGPEYDALVEKVKAKTGAGPIQAFHAHGYDATNILFDAIEKVAVPGPDGVLYIPKQALRDAIYATKDFPGITGSLTCSFAGACGNPASLAIHQVTAAEVGGAWPPAQFWP